MATMKTKNAYCEKTPVGADKVKRYGWTQDDVPGQLAQIDKNLLNIDYDYQRNPHEANIKAMSSAWSWIKCGTITVAERDGKFWVVDGQHRVLAAMRRSDISNLPCLVFKTKGQAEEAKPFGEQGGIPLRSVEKYKALLVSGDSAAVFVDGVIRSCGLRVENNDSNESIQCIRTILVEAGKNREAARNAIVCAAALCANRCRVTDRMIKGLSYLDQHIEGGLKNKSIFNRIVSIGPARITEAFNTIMNYKQLSPRSCAEAILEAINYRKHDKYEMKSA